MSNTSSIGRKVLMALTGFFLMFFLLQHASINFLSVVSPDTFNEVSHFMGINPLVQYALQPILIFSVVFHFVWGILLELKNRSSRDVKYAVNNGAANSTWMSRNMIISGLTVLAFLVAHFYDFWIHEITVKYIQNDMTGIMNGEFLYYQGEQTFRYYEELVAKFQDPIRVVLYVLSFVMLALHLLHGFQSSFQSVGFNHSKYTPIIKKAGMAFGILVPALFAFIAIFHFVAH